jgi:hypothetical protein
MTIRKQWKGYSYCDDELEKIIDVHSVNMLEGMMQ